MKKAQTDIYSKYVLPILAGVIGGAIGTLSLLWIISSLLRFNEFGSLTDWVSSLGTIGAIGAVAWQVHHADKTSTKDRLHLARAHFSNFYSQKFNKARTVVYTAVEEDKFLSFKKNTYETNNKFLTLVNTGKNDAINVIIRVSATFQGDKGLHTKEYEYGIIPIFHANKEIVVFNDQLQNPTTKFTYNSLNIEYTTELGEHINLNLIPDNLESETPHFILREDSYLISFASSVNVSNRTMRYNPDNVNDDNGSKIQND